MENIIDLKTGLQVGYSDKANNLKGIGLEYLVDSTRRIVIAVFYDGMFLDRAIGNDDVTANAA